MEIDLTITLIALLFYVPIVTKCLISVDTLMTMRDRPKIVKWSKRMKDAGKKAALKRKRKSAAKKAVATNRRNNNSLSINNDNN